uniref:Ubiquitin-like domain-containing protein n=1 Tax=Haptolina brevifila TaxID=156173 RepID=A0A7S2IFZ1_9EUKA|mmetsp:Transcript_65700/g.130133  ORF Transcript_65700/g.130133 Transcript_65700/m.130133 type:complete len:334 (+) Transcript_65700:103-1104(+)|eukprot:CAMPEP_0174700668 /NCGR_PEP_ID=MMETSP1094-20130205/5556_1 /TAXON_ID=156173 /ORGANISM="Chrysochromulina brevifilum, Strain UTEX LB 985" /LENGTH=333 /DNA_ID=CAMNT_0015898189 /DNA_START=79 /DNA_END=1080 /DNA_ORIENTATION=+
MALTFIGKSPNPLPLPPGLQLDPRRYVGITGPPAAQRSPTPSRVRVRYQITKPDGRIKPETQDVELIGLVEDLERCTVQQLIMLLHQHGPRSLQLLSSRHPIELRYHGETLAPEKLLSDYALKNNSELQVVIKPSLPDCEVRVRNTAAADTSITRLRLSSHKLVTPLCVEQLTPDQTVADVKARLRQMMVSTPMWLVRGPTPPVAAPPPIQLTQKDGSVFEVRVGDQFGKPEGGGGGGGKGKKGEGAQLKRASDGVLIEQAILEPELWQLTLNDPEDKLFNILHQGAVLPDEALLSACGLVNNEMLYLNFKAPWEPDEPLLPAKADKKGKKKK